LCRNWKELSKQIDESIQLTNHANHGPSYHDQKDAAEKGYNASQSVAPWKESKRSRDTYKPKKYIYILEFCNE
jgi:hypothetical protein